MQNKSLYIFSNGRLAAINKKDGSIIWEINLKKILKYSGYNIGQLVEDGDRLYVGASGQIACLSAKDGALLWKNELKGWGFQFISIANSPNENTAAETAQQQAAATAAIVAATVAATGAT